VAGATIFGAEAPMFKSSVLAVVLATSFAHAQGTDTPASAPIEPSVGGDPYQKGAKGLEFPLTLLTNLTHELSSLSMAEPIPTIGLLYFASDKAALDVLVGFNLHYQETIDPTTMMPTSTTVFGFAAGLGYRMYKHDGKLHTYLEPRGRLFWGDVNRTPTFGFGGGAVFGLERSLADWVALSGSVGGDVRVTNKFKDVQVVPSIDLSAIFYWK
jgi:hypothetical protein